jgi:hypothetical protein
MRARLTRARGLLERYRVDRRLPPPVRSLYETTARLRRHDMIERRAAAARPVSGTGGGPVARLGAQRLATSGVLDRPYSTAAIDLAHELVDVLADLEPFVVDLDGSGRVVVGLHVQDRACALARLGTARPEWFLRWHDRGSDGMSSLADRSQRRAKVSRRWEIFRSYAIGDRATGPETGAVVTFWGPGPSGELELVGMRGHERFDERSPHTTELIAGRSFPGRAAFPVGSDLRHLDRPVDLVYTWVDGDDEEWLASFRRTAEVEGRRFDEHALDRSRYRSRDELRASLRSVWMYCGWVRHIHVVTAGQRPAWLVDDDRISVVDHREIMPASALPTFNSHAIEASLHHIDGLAEHFVYFNDDMFVTRPTTPETFFHPNGLAKVFQSGARVPGIEDDQTPAVDTAARRGRELLQRRFGRVVVDKPLHSPYPLRRSVLDEIESEFTEVIEATRHSRFRSPSDLSTAASFAQHYAVATGRATFAEIVNEYVHIESKRLGWHLDRVRLGADVDTCCINESGHEHGVGPEAESAVADFFAEMFPIAAPWERDLDHGD